MKKLVVICALMTIFIGCGGGGNVSTDDNNSSFDASDFTNGTSSVNSTSQWNCSLSGASTSSVILSFYDDGTGASSSIGVFTWEVVGDQAVDIDAYNGTNQIRDIAGSTSSGIATFRQVTPSGGIITASCTLEAV